MQENYLGFPGEQWNLQKLAALLVEQKLMKKNRTSRYSTNCSFLRSSKAASPIQIATAIQYWF